MHNNDVTFRVSESSSGDYMCKSRRRDDSYSSTEWSEAFTLSASNKPRATLTAGTTIIPVGGSVTLTCSVQSSDGWKYEWFRRTQTTSEGQIRDQQNRDIRVSEGGIYSCRGTRGNPVYYTDRSDDVTIEKTISNKVVVKQQPNWPQIFRGETITLTCEVQEGGETTEWEYEWRGPSTPTQWTHNNDVTFRVSESSSGDYMCKSRRRDDSYSSTEWSEAFTLSASTSKPRATLTAHSSIIPAGGSVTLSCSVEGSAGWKFDWFRRDSVSSKAQLMRGNEANRVSQGGLYHCRGGRGDPVYYTEDSSDVTVTETLPSKPTVTLQPSWPQIYSGETVTVRCEIQGGEGKVWKYEWTAPNTNSPPTSSEYWISRVSVSHSGDYRCRGSSDYLLTGWSDAFRLTVSSSKPRATLIAQSSVIPAGGSVTLSCSVEGSAGWKFDWFRRDSVSSKAQLMRGNEANRVISVSQGGLYHCRGGRGDPVYYTEDSSDVTVTETLPSKPTVTLQPSWPQIYSGETVTVRCEIQGGEGAQWTYEWRAAKLNTPPTSNEYRIIRATESDSGGYSCRGRRDYFFSEWSDIITLTVSYKPKAKLRADNTAVPVGGSVTLTCSVNPSSSSGWKYYWYRDEKSSEALTTQDAVFHSNGQISVSQEGLYRCRGGRGNPVYYTEDSQSVRIGKTVSNRPVVTLYPNWSEIYRGETITVRCEIHGGDTEWDYEWETNSMIKAPNQNEYRIRSASSSNSGNYRCKGRMKSSQHETTEWSDSVTLTVSDNEPRPVLTVSPSWLSPGASVTLNCEVEHPSAGWSFYWYKAVPDLAEKSSSYELLPDGSGTAQDSYIIHGQTHTAGYVCRAGRGDPEYHTDHSQPKFVWSADVHSSASLTVSPDRVQHFTSDSVSLTCEGNFTEWRVRKFSEDGRLYSDCRRMTGSTCDINTSKSDTAVYWCESGSGEFSNAVNITVQNDGNGPILVSPVHPVTEGASVSLSCSLRTQKILSNVFFYHNDKLIENDPRGELKISAVSKSDEGFYKCQYSGRESAQSWMSVKVTVSGADSSSSPVWLMVGLVCGVSLIIILLLLLYRCTTTNKPRPVLTVSPSWLSPGASVTLNCEVEHPSAGWSFYWYKAVPDLSEKSSSYELLPDGSGTAQDSYIIHGQTHTAGYVCRAGRGDPEYHTDHSQPKFVWSADVHSAASLTVSPDRVQHFTSDSVSLTCEGNFTEWRVRKFSEDGFLSHCDCQKLRGSSYKIHSLQEGVTVYWCESDSGEFSNGVKLTVQGFGRERSSFIVPFIIGLVSGIIVVLLLMCCYRKIKKPCCKSLTQSPSTNQSSASQQTSNQNEAQVYSSLLHGDLSVYESIRGSGNTGSADEYNNVTSGFQLEGLDKRSP
ncbi:obscurin-like [Astatotilapia calliptera]|uniref:obscurin-like n=1 Tax=Astatotilapia calliptera TaxID=8154 RepID=UPI000E41E834|nr:obscurin-like [Astatotilapia calliptera]